MVQNSQRNITMLMDLYELTMSNGYFSDTYTDEQVVFDVFYRKNPDNAGFSIFAGLEQVIEYIENLHFDEEEIAYLRSLQIFKEEFLTYLSTYQFRGHIEALPEGTIMYPHEPILTVTASVIDAQLIETAVLTILNHQCLIATKAQRIVKAAAGRGVADFGARRAHNVDAAVYGARAAYIGGVASTATVLAGQMFSIPVSGTMAHSWVMYYGDEYEAFKQFASVYPDATILLVDTYDVLHSGIPNAIKLAKEVLIPQGKRLQGVRLDSGDLAYLSQKVRVMLDEAGLSDCKIMASNSLDEYTIRSILQQGGAIDGFGVGERLITAKSDPVFGCVYKMASVKRNGQWEPRIKVSESIEKITNPGRKALYRVYDAKGFAIADLIALADETVSMSAPYRYIHPQKPWKEMYFENCTVKRLQVPVIDGGKRVYPKQSLADIRKFVQHQIDHEIWREEQRFENPHIHYLDMSPSYYAMKMNLLDKVDKH